MEPVLGLTAGRVSAEPLLDSTRYEHSSRLTSQSLSLAAMQAEWAFQFVKNLAIILRLWKSRLTHRAWVPTSSCGLEWIDSVQGLVPCGRPSFMKRVRTRRTPWINKITGAENAVDQQNDWRGPRRMLWGHAVGYQTTAVRFPTPHVMHPHQAGYPYRLRSFRVNEAL